MPKYPIFIPSRGRFDNCLTAKYLDEENLPYHLIIEPQEEVNYSKYFNKNKIIVLPENNRGLSYSRNFIKDYSKSNNDDFHWQLDDRAISLIKNQSGKIIKEKASIAINMAKSFIDKYENIAIAGFAHSAFGKYKKKPFDLNVQVYSFVLVSNKNNIKWRHGIQEDTDYALQVLTMGWCTVLFNIYQIYKHSTGKIKGGMTDFQYKGNGRLKQIKELQRRWGSEIKITKKFGIPKAVTSHIWRKFTTVLKLKNE